MKDKRHVTVLGLGAMGVRIASNLVHAGYPVVGYNRTPIDELPRGIRSAASPQDAVKGADIVISMVTDDEASKSIWLDEEKGALMALPTEAIAIECSTVSKSWIEELASHFKAHKKTLLESPVLGSLPQAEAGQLVALVSSEDDEQIDQVNPILESFTGKVLKTGAIGRAAALKLTINAFLAIQAAALAELVPLTMSLGYEREELTDILSALPVTSPAAEALLGQIKSESYPSMFPIRLVEKDLRYVLENSELLLNSNLIKSTHKAFDLAVEKGLGKQNLSGVIQINEA